MPAELSVDPRARRPSCSCVLASLGVLSSKEVVTVSASWSCGEHQMRGFQHLRSIWGLSMVSQVLLQVLGQSVHMTGQEPAL